ncbi:MAG: c-type cytochrome [Candidatus Latescibacteria bacterium]|nr:c-type cytochrome [Candidatus Latescibacterota bacterium]
MKSLSKLFAISSLIFLIVLAVSPLKDYFREWKRYQKAYNRLIETLPTRVKPVKLGIRQVWNPELGVVDRCVTCHVGIGDPALKKAPQPFRTHPEIPHDIAEFGCTICHQGQGLATTFREAIGNVKYWDRPTLPVQFIESSCGKCHKEDDVPDAPSLTLGRRLLVEANCTGCHRIAGVKKGFTPNLNGIGSKVNRTWLFQWLKTPKALIPNARMPNFLLTDGEAAILTDYLLTFKDRGRISSFPESLTGMSDVRREALYDLGRTRFSEARCISCHQIEGRGGHLAPDLGGIATKTSPEWLYSYLTDPHAFQPDVEMPRYGFTDEERLAVVVYMMTDFTGEGEEGPAIPSSDPAFFEKGEKLFKTYNCGGCHRLEGGRAGEELGPELSTVGSKPSYEIEFGKVKIEHTLPAYIYAKLTQPRSFVSGLKMPDYGFAEEEATALTNALLNLTEEQVPERYRIPRPLESTYTPQGPFGKLMQTYACLACHRINGRGGTMAPALSREGSQATREWIARYFKIPYSLRPILTERMPNLFIGDDEIQTIVQYIDLTILDDTLDAGSFPADARLVESGKVLFFEKYGCQSCHQVGSAGGGYVGPPLTDVGTRLTPGWIYRWLENPQAYKPDTIEPNNGIPPDELRAITTYLMSLNGEQQRAAGGK